MDLQSYPTQDIWLYIILCHISLFCLTLIRLLLWEKCQKTLFAHNTPKDIFCHVLASFIVPLSNFDSVFESLKGPATASAHSNYYYFASVAVAVDSNHMTASSSASWSRFCPPSNFVNAHSNDTLWWRLLMMILCCSGLSGALATGNQSYNHVIIRNSAAIWRLAMEQRTCRWREWRSRWTERQRTRCRSWMKRCRDSSLSFHRRGRATSQCSQLKWLSATRCVVCAAELSSECDILIHGVKLCHTIYDHDTITIL